MTKSERLDSINDARLAGVLTFAQAVMLVADALGDTDTYCYTSIAGDWYAWLGDRKDPQTGYRGVRVPLPASDAELYGPNVTGSHAS